MEYVTLFAQEMCGWLFAKCINLKGHAFSVFAHDYYCAI